MKVKQILEQQGHATPRAPSGGTAIAVVDSNATLAKFASNLSQDAVPGVRVKLDVKNKAFIRADTGEALPAGDTYRPHYKLVVDSWVKFGGEGVSPQRIGGMPAEGFVLPPREELGDTDSSLWEDGLNGQPQDPWQHEVMLPLEHTETSELLVFVTSSITGRRAVGKLLAHCARIERAFPNEMALVQLKVTGYEHRDSRIGWVTTPTLAVIGRVPKVTAPAALPAPEYDDSIPL
jgi:hypothetical protein